ncbi:MAG TPA: hypothetical protein VN253_09450 [Kofleriaceae bacterium]|nr:hypothetical protein [Kofleriaceae bacterium]
MRVFLLGFALVLLSFGAARADGKQQVRYIGIHPIAASAGGGFCYIEGPHVHIYPVDKLQYRDHRGYKHFVGDPVAYGYDGPKHAYKGHHPIHVDVVVGDDDPDEEFCYIDGPHYHYFEPADGPEFKVAGDAYFYVADPPKVYVDARPAMIGINAVYKPLVYTRPVITVDAPVGWIGARAEFVTPVVVAPAVVAPVVVAPAVGIGVDVRIPVPSVRVDVGVGVPGVIVRDHRAPMKHKKHKGRKW